MAAARRDASHVSDNNRLTDREIRVALRRAIQSPTLAKSHQLAQFLIFIVEETLAGHGDRLKAYTIATDALGRDANFDPQTDPIVRVEAGRLRRGLERYYAADGRNDPVVIELPTGRYTPVFRNNTVPRGAVARFRIWRRDMVDALRTNIRLVVLIVFVAAMVSLSLDFLWMLLGVEHNPVAALIRNAPAATSPPTTGSLKP